MKNIFWGLVVKPGKRYETVVQEPFRITKVQLLYCYNSYIENECEICPLLKLSILPHPSQTKTKAW